MPIVHDLIVYPQNRPLSGSVPVPPDPRIGEGTLMVAALASGRSEVRGLPKTGRLENATRLLGQLGVTVTSEAGDLAVIRGASLTGLRALEAPLDCGAFPSTIHLLAGILVAQTFRSVLTAQGAPSRLGMSALAAPLRRRGGQIEGAFSQDEVGEITVPLVMGPLGDRQRLAELDHAFTEHRDYVKEALLLSGLFADGPTYVRERVVSSDHLERLLQALDVPLATAGAIIELDVERWEAKLPPFGAEIPGDFSAALVLLVAGTLVPQSRVTARKTGLNTTRTAALMLLRQMGGAVDIEVHAHRLGEAEGTASASYADLRATTMAGETLACSMNDVAMLAVLAARARGQSEIGDGEARGGARFQRLAQLVRAFGVEAKVEQGSLFVEGRPDGALTHADVESDGDPQLVLAGTLLGLLGDAPSRIRSVDALPEIFPRFVAILRALGASIELVERTI